MKCEIIESTAGGKTFKYCKTHHVEPQDCPVGVSEDAMELAATKLLEDVIDPEGYACWLPKQIPTQPKGEVLTGAKATVSIGGKVVGTFDRVSWRPAGSVPFEEFRGVPEIKPIYVLGRYEPIEFAHTEIKHHKDFIPFQSQDRIDADDIGDMDMHDALRYIAECMNNATTCEAFRIPAQKLEVEPLAPVFREMYKAASPAGESMGKTGLRQGNGRFYGCIEIVTMGQFLQKVGQMPTNQNPVQYNRKIKQGNFGQSESGTLDEIDQNTVEYIRDASYLSTAFAAGTDFDWLRQLRVVEALGAKFEEVIENAAMESFLQMGKPSVAIYDPATVGFVILNPDDFTIYTHITDDAKMVATLVCRNTPANLKLVGWEKINSWPLNQTGHKQ